MQARFLILAVVLSLVSVPLLSGCDDDSIRPSDAPEDHTVNQDGIGHAPGLNDPGANCTGCHGADLSGSNEAPSCTSCHGQEW